MGLGRMKSFFMTICHALVIISLICPVIIVSSLRTPSSSSPLPSLNLSELSHATNVTMDDIVTVQEDLGFLDPHTVIKNVVSNVTRTWSSISQKQIHEQSFKDSSTVEEKWIKSASLINELINVAIKSSLPLILDLAYSSDLSPKCSASMLQILSGIKSNRGWALSFLDSSGRIPPGLMTGTLTSLGDYDQCLRIEVKDQVTTDWDREKERNSSNEGKMKRKKRNKEDSSFEIGSSRQKSEQVNDDHEEDEDVDGNVDGERIKLESMSSLEEEKILRGQYCLLRARPVLPVPDLRTSLKDVVINVTGTVLEPTIYKDIAAVAHGFYSIPLQFALCIPSTCTPRELEEVIQQILEPIHFTATLGPICDVKTDKNILVTMDNAQLLALAVIAIIIFFVLLLSFLDILMGSCYNVKESNNFFLTLCDSFSIVKNTSKLFSLKTESEPKLHFIHGMRVLTMIWVIICHTYTFGTQFLTAIGSIRIEHEIRPLSRTLSMQFILNGWFSVETFFFLSGVIVIYVGYPLMIKSKGKLSLIKFIAFRWIRFTPAMGGIILLHFLWPLLGSGPVFKEQSELLLKPCYTDWWKNFLYINNWVSHPDQICLKHTWYLSADFQFHIVAYFALQIIFWYKNYAHALNLFMIIMGMIIPAMVVYFKSLPPTLIINTPFIEKFEGYFSQFYFPTYNHITPYFIGLTVGYMIVTKNHFRVGRITSSILWITLPILALVTLLSTYIWNGLEIDTDPISSTIYAGVHRFIWISAVAWIALNSSFNLAGIVGRILCSKLWIPFSRLSYQVYLVHFIVIYYHFLTQRSPVRFTHYERLFMSCGSIIYSLIFAFFTYIFFEAPLAALIKCTIVEKLKINDESDHGQEMNVVEVFVTPDQGSNVHDDDKKSREN